MRGYVVYNIQQILNCYGVKTTRKDDTHGKEIKCVRNLDGKNEK
jgi:hypothetical protein